MFFNAMLFIPKERKMSAGKARKPEPYTFTLR